ncbi:type IV secretory system conjugative DNA transfer family protein (plasmid) [Achromobacter sp. CF-sbj1-Ac2-l]|uniref:type IV secretory system conjugative DNA transfer family protein n=1 Tax=Achromobacter sp. CF-sbj1-Ac2-l TaxID=3444091 RepID=UPI004046E13B
MATEKNRLQTFEAARTPLQNVLLGILAMMFIVVIASACATQFFAAKTNYSRHLGEPLFSLGSWAAYLPFEWIGWGWRFADIEAVKPTVYQMTVIALSGSAIGLVAGMLVTFFAFKRTTGMESLHGDAHWATAEEVDRTGLLGHPGADLKGILVGSIMLDKEGETVTPAHADYRSRHRLRMNAGVVMRDADGRPLLDANPSVVLALQYLRDNAPTHVLVFAPTRSGKGRGLIIPTLFAWAGSTVVADQKGENYALTAGMRSRAGQRVGKFAPTCNDGSGWKWNPLDEIRKFTDRDVADAQNICQMIVDPDNKGMEDHFISMAWMLLTAVALHHIYAETDASLGGMVMYLSDPRFETDTQMWQRMLDAEHDPELKMGWVDTAGVPTKTHPLVASQAASMMKIPEEERGSILTTAKRVLGLWLDPLVAANTRTSDFLCRDLMTLDDPVSLYYIPTEEDKDRLTPLSRLFFAMIIRRNTVPMSAENGRLVGGYKHRLLLLIDEFPALGKIEIIEDALSYVAGYGIKLMLICQDLRQLQDKYGDNETIVAGCHIRIAYGPSDERTAKRLEEMVGETTVAEEEENVSANRMGISPGNVSVSRKKTGRPLMTAGEWMTLSNEDLVLLVANNPPIYGRKIKYDEVPDFAAWSKLPAPHANPPLRERVERIAPRRQTATMIEIMGDAPALTLEEKKIVDQLLANHIAIQEIQQVRAF